MPDCWGGGRQVCQQNHSTVCVYVSVCKHNQRYQHEDNNKPSCIVVVTAALIRKTAILGCCCGVAHCKVCALGQKTAERIRKCLDYARAC